VGAAVRLRLLEARRRGGVTLLVVGVAVVFAIARLGTDTVAGSYGLATDIAATLGYLGAVFLGAFPLASDRERKRAYLPGASPVSPWTWGLGNALGAALVVGAATLLLFVAAGLGTSLRGGIETHAVTRPARSGTLWLRPGQRLAIPVPAKAKRLRLPTRTHLAADETVGTPDAATLEVDGEAYSVAWNQALVVEVERSPVVVVNRSPEFVVGIVADDVRAFVEPRGFLGNAAVSAVPPALGAAALAAFGCAAGAHLAGAVAALLTAVVLLLASMKGFLLETIEHEGGARAAREAGQDPHEHHHHHHDRHAPRVDLEGTVASEVAKAFTRALLAALPDLGALDRTDRVALGEWTGPGATSRALLCLTAALALAAGVGGLGVYLRRTP